MLRSFVTRVVKKITGWIRSLLFFIKKPEKGSFEEHSINVNIKYIDAIILNRLLKFDASTQKSSENVEEKYRLSTMKLKGNKKHWYMKDGEIVEILSMQVNGMQMQEVIRVAEESDCRSILEVGAGLLINIDYLLKKKPGINVSAIDLSFNRLVDGKGIIQQHHGIDIPVAKANAVSLPFPDDYFDLVYSRHALEHMPLDYKEVIDEMIRVSRKAVVLLEPSYELGGLSQKLKMTATHYVKGIKKYFDSRGLDLDEYRLLSVGPVYNRTALYVMKHDDKTKSQNENITVDYCPDCKAKMKKRSNEYLFCKECETLYFIYDGVPVLDKRCGVGLSVDLWKD